MYLHLSEQVLQKFGYLQGPHIVSHMIVHRRDYDAIFIDYHEYLVLENVYRVPDLFLWSTL